MMNSQELKAITRDVLLVLILGYLSSFIHKLFLQTANPPSASEILTHNLLGLAEGIIIFTVIGIFARNNIWKHLLSVSTVIFTVSIIRLLLNIQGRIPIVNVEVVLSLVSVPLIYQLIVTGMGGLLASTYIKFLIINKLHRSPQQEKVFKKTADGNPR